MLVNPGFELARTPGHELKISLNPGRVRQPPNPFRVGADVCRLTQGSRKLEPWADISERLRRIFKLNHYLRACSGWTFFPLLLSLQLSGGLAQQCGC